MSPKIKREDRPFVERATRACESLGPRAVLALVGSRAAGMKPVWDLDLWVIGDKEFLSGDQRAVYEEEGELFVDRGDLQAHWIFFDQDDLTQTLSQWPAEKMWIVSTAKYLHGKKRVLQDLQRRFSRFPRKVAASKLRWLVGSYRSLVVPAFKAATAGSVTSAFTLTGMAVSTLARLCCAADCRPWPYPKWLVAVAKTTRLGGRLMGFADRAVKSFLSHPTASGVLHSSDWPPTRELKAALEALPKLLRGAGWRGDWVDDPWQAVSETYRREAP